MFSQRWFLVVLITLMYVQVFLLVSLLLVSYLMLLNWGGIMIVCLRLGLQEYGQDFDTMAPLHDHYCAGSGSK